MEQLTQRILETTLVTLIKGVAIAGLLADVVMYYASKNSEKIAGMFRRRTN